MSARQVTAAALPGEDMAYISELEDWNSALQRADIIVSTSIEQRNFYLGVLAALGQFRPSLYGSDGLILVPFGIHRDEVKSLQGPQSTNTIRLLWAGGVYPWFEIEVLLTALEKGRNEGLPIELTLVGLNNPYVEHPHFRRIAQEAIRKAKLTPGCEVCDWVPYEDRLKVMAENDWLITLSKPGLENSLSWRTRLSDAVAAGLPVISNGGDPFFERIAEGGGGLKIRELTVEGLLACFRVLAAKGDQYASYRQAIETLREGLYWDECTAVLADCIGQPAKSLKGLTAIIHDSSTAPSSLGLGKRVLRQLKRLKQLARHHRNGFSFARGCRDFLASSLKSLAVSNLILARRQSRRLVILCHQLDYSGAPKVAIDIAIQARTLYIDKVVVYIQGSILTDLYEELSEAGVVVKAALFGDLPPPTLPNDTVLINSYAIEEVIRNLYIGGKFPFSSRRLLFYAHEYDPSPWVNPDRAMQLRSLIMDRRLQYLTPSAQTSSRHAAFFELPTSFFKVQIPQAKVPDRLTLAFEVNERSFQTIHFFMSGTIRDGRKGHARTLGLFSRIIAKAANVSPERYRPFTFHLLGFEGNDYINQELLNLGNAILGERFIPHKKTNREEALEIASRCNVTLCNSYEECQPLFVLEALQLGHVILHNGCAGLKETLGTSERANGFFLPTEHEEASDVLLRLLSIKDVSEEMLRLYSCNSRILGQELQQDPYKTLFQYAFA
jgi:glycosyltransferase involved in cell wall biosynthesis